MNIIGKFEPIKNGSEYTFGDRFKTTLKSDQHHNWFQKKMWKILLGITVTDYSEDEE